VPGLLRGMARTAVVAGTATAVSNRVSRRQMGRWAEQDATSSQASAPPAQAPVAAAPAEGDDTIAKLKDLGELRDSGVLTEEEFAAQKAKLLGS
jgi:Short C-terminal domain